MYSRFHQNGKRKTDSHNLSWSQQICKLTTPEVEKYYHKLIQIQKNMNLIASFMSTQNTIGSRSWLGKKWNRKNWQILLENETNTCTNTGGAERTNWRCSSSSCSIATNACMRVLSIEKWLSIHGRLQINNTRNQEILLQIQKNMNLIASFMPTQNTIGSRSWLGKKCIH